MVKSIITKIRKDLESKNIKFKSNSDTEVIIESYKYWGEKIYRKTQEECFLSPYGMNKILYLFNPIVFFFIFLLFKNKYSL